MAVNKLILGDNLEVLRDHIESETVDLIYLDPPFFSNRNYEVIWGDDGEVRSFQDRWAGGVDNYIIWLKTRVEQMHRVLKPTGSIFLHCDWHASHYIKTEILDRIFGMNNFRNEIVWCYRKWSVADKCFSKNHDTIFFYTKSDAYTYNQLLQERAESTLKRFGSNKIVSGFDTKGHRIPSKTKQEHSEGVKMYDWWDIPIVPPSGHERIGYPTQKPMALLERIIKCASNEGDLVLDPFLGGGTTLAVADKLNRKWIGIDQSVQAVKVTELRLQRQTDIFTSLYANSYTLQLHKYDYDTLRYKDAFEFESWIIGQFGGVARGKKGGDKGIDGKAADGAPIQVKRSENIGVNVVKNFWASTQQYDKNLFEKNRAEGKPVGYIIAFSFGKGAREEVARLKLKENIIIELVQVEDIIPVSKKPKVNIEINELSRDASGIRELELTVAAHSEAGIEFFSWDFDYHPDKGFKPLVIIDKEGKQQYKFKAGVHNIAVKAVDNDGLESTEIIKLKVNGTVERS
jgi:DNA modification methylase